MKNKVKIGIIGCGPRIRGLTYIYRLHPNVEFVAVCDIVEQFAHWCKHDLETEYTDVEGNRAKKENIPVYTDYKQMINEVEMDAVLIGSDPMTQADIACDCMRQRKHVMTEVPCAYTIEQCWNLVDTCEETKMKYMISEQTRYWDFIRKWRNMARNGQFGHIQLVEGEYMHYEAEWDYWIDKVTGQLYYGVAEKPNENCEKTWRYRSFEHPIYYLPHTLSPLLSILNDRVTKVCCFGTKLGSYKTEGLEVRDIEMALMHTSKDTVMRVGAGFTSPHGHRDGTWAHWYHIKGVDKSVEWCRSTIDKPKEWSPEKGWSEVNLTTEDLQSEDYIKNSGHGGADWWPIDDFVTSILNDTEPKMNVYRAVDTAAPAICAAISSEQGGVLIEVPDFRAKYNRKFDEYAD